MYGRVEPWQQEVAEFARVHGYTQTAYGNRRHATQDLYSTDETLRMRQERQLCNATVQGTAADILKKVRQEIVIRNMRDKYTMRAIRPVYDEITASIPVDAVPDYCEELVEVMSITPPGYPVGMAVELSIGRTWGGQLEVKGTGRAEVEKTLQEVLSSK
jgi:DNA polymerase-1